MKKTETETNNEGSKNWPIQISVVEHISLTLFP